MNDELRIWEVAEREVNRMTAEINKLRTALILLKTSIE